MTLFCGSDTEAVNVMQLSHELPEQLLKSEIVEGPENETVGSITGAGPSSPPPRLAPPHETIDEQTNTRIDVLIKLIFISKK